MLLMNKVKGWQRRPELPGLVILIAVIVMNIALQPNFFSGRVIRSNLASFTPLILVSIAQGVVIISGGLDLSIGAGITLLNCIMAATLKDWGYTGIIAAFLAAIIIGIVNGFATGYLKLSPLIVTFATSAIWSGLALAIMPQPGGFVPQWFSRIYYSTYAGLPAPLLFIFLAVLIWWLVTNRKLGRYIYAVGSNAEGAYANGINVSLVKMATYVLSATIIFLTAFVLTAQTASGDPYIGKAYTLNSVAAVVIGGISLSGGKGSIIGAIIGAVILSFIVNIIYFANIASTYQEFIKGMIIVLALTMSILNKKAALLR